jgi:uncharacterized membrane protein
MPTATFVLTFLAALGSGLIAGLFAVFSNFMMKALGGLAPEKGMAAMQAINVAILNPAFLGVFLGTALVSLALVIFAVLHWGCPAAMWLLAGGLLYLVGGIAVTMVFNVPMNDALAAANPATAEGAALWSDYLSRWTAWNHVRSVATLAATAAYIYALIQFRATSGAQ